MFHVKHRSPLTDEEEAKRQQHRLTWQRPLAGTNSTRSETLRRASPEKREPRRPQRYQNQAWRQRLPSRAVNRCRGEGTAGTRSDHAATKTATQTGADEVPTPCMP